MIEHLETYDPEKVVVVGVHAPTTNCIQPDFYFEEFLSLVHTLGISYKHSHFIKIRSISKSHFLPKGKMLELGSFCHENKIELIIFSELLSPMQERNLEQATGSFIMDREQLILEIFKKSAASAEGKIQVEMAEVQFLKTRLAKKNHAFMQQTGVKGSRGPGETIKERMRRHFEEKLRKARKKIEHLENVRQTQRKNRDTKEFVSFSLVGYTNAGKSSLMNCMTKSEVLVKDALFATLDTTTRVLHHKGEKLGVLSDTVGFIDNLPHQLIKAFSSTLEEVCYADLILHVIDASNPSWQHHINVVMATLKKLKADDKPILFVFNKIDKLSPAAKDLLMREAHAYHPFILCSAITKEGIQDLYKYLEEFYLSSILSKKESAHEQ